MPRSANSNLQNNYNESALANDGAINYRNIILANLDEPINVTFSMPPPLNSLVAKLKTNFTANDPHIKKYEQTTLDYLKRQILTEVTPKVKRYNISKCNTSSTPDIVSSLKSHIQTFESQINFHRIARKKCLGKIFGNFTYIT